MEENNNVKTDSVVIKKIADDNKNAENFKEDKIVKVEDKEILYPGGKIKHIRATTYKNGVVKQRFLGITKDGKFRGRR